MSRRASVAELLRTSQAWGGGGGGGGGGAEVVLHQCPPASTVARWFQILPRSRRHAQSLLLLPNPLHPRRYVYPDCRAPGGRNLGAPNWDWLWAWAAAHAPLRTLCFDLGEEDEPAGLMAVAQRLQACRPGLRVERCRFAMAWKELGADWQ